MLTKQISGTYLSALFLRPEISHSIGMSPRAENSTVTMTRNLGGILTPLIFSVSRNFWQMVKPSSLFLGLEFKCKMMCLINISMETWNITIWNNKEP